MKQYRISPKSAPEIDCAFVGASYENRRKPSNTDIEQPH